MCFTTFLEVLQVSVLRHIVKYVTRQSDIAPKIMDLSPFDQVEAVKCSLLLNKKTAAINSNGNKISLQKTNVLERP